MWRVTVSAYSGDRLVWKHLVPREYKSKGAAKRAGQLRCSREDEFDRVFEVYEEVKGDCIEHED